MPTPLKIAVAGGGIGGLAAALALRCAGAEDVQLYESAPAFEPLGAGLQLGPNAVRILQHWGLGPALAQVAFFPESLEVCSAMSGKRLAALALGKAVVLRYGAAHATVHRADLHALLLQALTSSNPRHGASSPVPVHLGCALRRLAQDSDAVQLAFARQTAAPDLGAFESTASTLQGTGDGNSNSDGIFEVQADALIGADGLWSTVRKQLLPGGPPSRTGHQAFRALLPQSALPAALRGFASIRAWLGPGLHAVSYPVRSGDWFNMVVIVQNRVLRERLGSPVSLELEEAAAQAMPAADAVAAALADSHCCTLLRDTVAAAGAGSSTGWQRWPLFDRVPMRSAHEHVKGRVALLGDAAHPMRPYLAQGAAMAIEDAAALANSLVRVAHGGNAVDRIPARLQHYAQQRWQRNAQVQARAKRNGLIFHATGPVRWCRDAALQLLGARIVDMPWLYGYGREAHQHFPGER